MKFNNSARRIAFQKKIMALIVSMLLLLSVFSYNSPTAFAANDMESPLTEDTMQFLGEFQGDVKRPNDIPGVADGKDDLSDSEKKISTKLLRLVKDDYISSGTTQNELINQMEDIGQLVLSPITNGVDGESSGIEVYVYIKFDQGVDPSIFAPHVVRIVDQNEDYGLATAWVDINSLDALASLEGINSIKEVVTPIVKSGTVLSEGDALHQTDLVRTQTGADGTGVKIGIISDGVDHYLDAVASGNLPTDVTILSNTQGGDEGTAMLEIVYDLAPGADLYFYDMGSSTLAFINAIDALAAAGCTVICDDIGWITQPFFEDGIIAQHVQTLTATGDIVYTSSAGNAAASHYQGQFYDDGYGWADFSSGGDPSFPDLYVELGAGESIRVVLEWNEYFGSSGSNYDLALFNASSYDLLEVSTDVQNGNDDPFEWIAYTNPGATMNVAIAVFAENAPVDKILEIYIYGGGTYTNNIVAADSIFGHAAVPGVLSTGAVHASDPNNLAYYSSQGPVTLVSGSRQKPDICGAAGVAVTGAGGFSNPFYGTSAAAPHIAAIAAILQQRFPLMSTSEIKQLILENGVDLGSSGYDLLFGYGRADALAAALEYVYVDFDTDGGSAVDTQLILNGGKVTEPSEPTKADSIFGGWYKEDTFDNPWIFASDTVAVDTTIFAKWTADITYVTGVTLNKSSTRINIGETETLVVTVAPSDAEDKSVTWSSSNESIATVFGGVVTAVALGSATITVTTTDGEFTYTCSVTVIQSVTGVQLDKTEIDILEGETDTLVATVSPGDAVDKSITWSTSDDSIATVVDGVVTAVLAGEATITVTTQDGGFAATCVVTVKAEQLESSVYTIDTVKNYLKGAAIGTTAAQFKEKFDGDTADIKIFDAAGAEYFGDYVATGMVVKLVLDGVVKDELTIIIRGDTNGDGAITIVDYTLVRLHILELKTLLSEYLAASDIDEVGGVSIVDYTLIRLNILGLKSIH